MGLSDYWKSNRGRRDAAEQFLQTGRSPDESFFIFGASSNTDTSSSSQECFDSSDCASGWACNGGKCKQSDTGAGDNSYGDTSGCGGGSGGGGGGGGCGASTGSSTGSSSSGCTKSGCGGSNGGGGNGGGGDCCGGERCCRYNGSSVSCSCGNCPPPPDTCSRFCTDYSAANGEPAPGCGDGNTCSECESCREDPETGIDKCLPRAGGPCYCPNSFCSGKCATCTSEGTCEGDCANCQTCYTAYKECSCGTVKKTCCYSACDQTKGFTECRESINCGEECGDPPGGGGDPCEGDCRTVTTCTPDEPPPCPPGSSCTKTGGISGGGQTCTLTTICDKSSVPDSCKDCDCNCDNDCPECFICSASGECVPDPDCNCDSKFDCPFCHTCKESGNGCEPQRNSETGKKYINCAGTDYCCQEGECYERTQFGECCRTRFSTKPHTYVCLNSLPRCVQGSLTFDSSTNTGCCIDACTGESKCRSAFCSSNSSIIESPDDGEIGDCCQSVNAPFQYAFG